MCLLRDKPPEDGAPWRLGPQHRATCNSQRLTNPQPSPRAISTNPVLPASGSFAALGGKPCSGGGQTLTSKHVRANELDHETTEQRAAPLSCSQLVATAL
ncbi:hypothetical protein QQF64_026457 [Cirrhinus molitorella]|uniref:Uncharacterized protein n=1 Tax=Cirrhinus molitorella TaxID=172907 RepID=A0ABR3N9M5_9TELE